MIVKIGPKQKHIKVPDGYNVVKEGKVKQGDIFCAVGDYPKIYWQRVDDEDVGDDISYYDCLIRPD